MASETILVIDAGEEIEQRMTTILEAEGYVVFTATSQVLNTEVLEKLSPSLIYISPLAPTAAGLEPCKAIHGIPSLENVPIVLLATPKDPHDHRFSTIYGIADFLRLTFGPGELIEKTEAILGKPRPSQLQKRDERGKEESAKDLQAIPYSAEAEDHLRLTEKEFTELTLVQKRVPPVVREQWDEEEQEQGKGLTDESHWSDTTRGIRKKRSALFLSAIGAAIFLVIVGLGFLVYDWFTPTGKISPVRSVTAPSPVPSKAPDARSGPQVPSEKKVEDVSAPASPAPPIPSPREPSLSPESAPQRPPKLSYSVQLGAYKNEAYAQALVTELREKGYEAITQPGVTKDKSPIYRVLVGKYEDRKAAEKLARQIQSKEKVKTTLYSE